MTDERSHQLDTEQEALAGRSAQMSGDAATLQSDHDAAAERERELGRSSSGWSAMPVTSAAGWS